MTGACGLGGFPGSSWLIKNETNKHFRKNINIIWAKIKCLNFVFTERILLDDYTYYWRNDYQWRLQFNVTP